jgi:hypothetical protein
MTNVKFFDVNLIDSGCTFTLTSALTTLAKRLYDNMTSTSLFSIASTDATPEVWTIAFAAPVTMNRIFIREHNIKSGSLKYRIAGAYTDFSTPIVWTANTTVTTNYYAFTSVVGVTSIQLTMDTTITANAEKTVSELRAFVELGTLVENCKYLQGELIREKASIIRVSGGGFVRISFGEKLHVKLVFRDALTTDLTLIESLNNRTSPFYVYLGGGYLNEQELFRVQDMYFVNYVNQFSPALKNNLLNAGTTIEMELAET